jgi:hypothetical protein
MSQTTMKIDRDVLADLRELATSAHRSPQKHLRYLVEVEKAKSNGQVKLEDMELTPEQQVRLDIVHRVEASSALEGYAPLSEEGGYAYELQKRQVLGEITTEEEISLLKAHHGLK